MYTDLVIPALPKIFEVVEIDVTTVGLEWSLVEGVDAYIIEYTGFNSLCGSINEHNQTLIFTRFDAPVRNFTVVNGLEEGTEYSVGLYTLNGSGRSAQTLSRVFETNSTGILK